MSLRATLIVSWLVICIHTDEIYGDVMIDPAYSRDVKGEEGSPNGVEAVDGATPLVRKKRGEGAKGEDPAPISSWVVPFINSAEGGEANMTLGEGLPGNTTIVFESSPPAVAYNLTDQSPVPMFTVYEQEGQLRLENEIDFENGLKTYVLTVEGEGEDGSTSTVTVTIMIVDVNDEPPIFSDALYKVVVPDSSPQGLTIGSLTVRDMDHTPAFRDVSLSISDGDTDKLFVVFDDGTLKIGYGKTLVNKTAYYLTVRAYDGINERFTNVVVGICSSKVLTLVSESQGNSIHKATHMSSLLTSLLMSLVLLIPYLQTLVVRV